MRIKLANKQPLTNKYNTKKYRNVQGEATILKAEIQ